MDIVIIGSGNVAHCFGRLLKLNGHQIKQILSRNEAHAKELGEKLNTDFETNFKKIYRNADVYILAVSDDAISTIAEQLYLTDQLVVHTAGSIEMDVLENVSSRYGVLYPLQTIRKEAEGNKKIPLLIEANSALALNRIRSLGNAISDNIEEMDSAERRKMHLTAIFCNNFPNFLMTLCKSYCKRENLDFELLYPLLDETFVQMKKPLEETKQTGPAIRGDESTIEKHLTLLEEHPEFKEIYQVTTKNIKDFFRS